MEEGRTRGGRDKEGRKGKGKRGERKVERWRLDCVKTL